MQVTKIVTAVVLALASAGAFAAGRASLTCGSNGPVYEMDNGNGNGQPVYLNVSYPTGGDAGTPGLFWVGIISPDQKVGAVLTERGWEEYQGGLYPFQSRHDGGLPGTISLSLPFPNNALTTNPYVGYSVYLGHGAYTTAMRQKVADRRAALDRVKPTLVASGKWNPEFDRDERFIWSLIQKDMVDQGKYGAVVTIPAVSCVRSSSSSRSSSSN